MEHISEQNRRLELLNRAASEDDMQFSLTFCWNPVDGWMWAVTKTCTLTDESQDIWRANSPLAAIQFAEEAILAKGEV